MTVAVIFAGCLAGCVGTSGAQDEDAANREGGAPDARALGVQRRPSTSVRSGARSTGSAVGASMAQGQAGAPALARDRSVDVAVRTREPPALASATPGVAEATEVPQRARGGSQTECTGGGDGWRCDPGAGTVEALCDAIERAEWDLAVAELRRTEDPAGFRRAVAARSARPHCEIEQAEHVQTLGGGAVRAVVVLAVSAYGDQTSLLVGLETERGWSDAVRVAELSSGVNWDESATFEPARPARQTYGLSGAVELVGERTSTWSSCTSNDWGKSTTRFSTTCGVEQPYAWMSPRVTCRTLPLSVASEDHTFDEAADADRLVRARTVTLVSRVTDAGRIVHAARPSWLPRSLGRALRARTWRELPVALPRGE